MAEELRSVLMLIFQNKGPSCGDYRGKKLVKHTIMLWGKSSRC